MTASRGSRGRRGVSCIDKQQRDRRPGKSIVDNGRVLLLVERRNIGLLCGARCVVGETKATEGSKRVSRPQSPQSFSCLPTRYSSNQSPPKHIETASLHHLHVDILYTPTPTFTFPCTFPSSSLHRINTLLPRFSLSLRIALFSPTVSCHWVCFEVLRRAVYPCRRKNKIDTLSSNFEIVNCRKAGLFYLRTPK